eukprot:CAMPEP_0172686320 /NCGR_PEP_ID=MMETSP1074-20121228/20855_1 /TAXON_ID=2916 /ORGANISM="Ceratium fusus, Strain PA161109" /LENGTH=82 /DNA_ID=CAMNT_0013505601 /DNA_START=154 /DNA_END=402 /DNA_ORIENTATION=-
MDKIKETESDNTKNDGINTVTLILITVGSVLVVLVAVLVGLFLRYRWQRKGPVQQSGGHDAVVVGQPVSAESADAKGNASDS